MGWDISGIGGEDGTLISGPISKSRPLVLSRNRPHSETGRVVT